MDKNETARLLSVLQAAWPNYAAPNPDATVAAYQLGLDDVPYEAAMAAAREWIKTGRFFPTASELRTIIAEKCLGMPSPEDAWAEVMDGAKHGIYGGQPGWSCRAIGEAVAAIGWRTICLTDVTRTDLMRGFTEVYGVYRDRSMKGADLARLWSERRSDGALVEETAPR
jgi:hypothetical protein